MTDRDFLTILGLNIKIIRTIKGLSQDDIAGALEVDKSYYSKLERGLANPSILYLKNLSEYLNIDIKEMIDINFDHKKYFFTGSHL